jgi:hypothetical protein
MALGAYTTLLGYQDLQRQYHSALCSCVDDLGLDWAVSWRQSGEVAWCQVTCKGKTLPSQGWKIHVSASAGEAVSLCNDVLSWLLSQGVTCKIAADVASIVRLNSGLAGETQTGKILTVYPSGDQEAACLALELDRRWAGTEGPAIPSDLAVSAQGAVYLRYGAFDGEPQIDRFGKISSGVRMTDGTVVEDLRSGDGTQPDWVAPPLLGLLPALAEMSGPFVVGGESYLPLCLLNASPQGKVFSGLSLSDAAQVLIKVSRRGVGGGLLGSSEGERLGAEYVALRALKRSRGVAPQPIGYLKGSQLTVLVTEYVEGDQFSDLDVDDQISSLSGLASAVSDLHEAGFVHRDIKLANVIVTESNVRLVDFELAAPIGSEVVASAGTRGYVPPESGGRTDGAGDVYALGACVAHVYLGFDPGGLPPGGGRLVGLLALFGYGRVAFTVRKLLDAQPGKRPSAKTVVQMLDDLRPGIASAELDHPVGSPRPRGVKAEWCLRAAREAGLAAREFQRDANPGLLWKSRHYENFASAEGINIGSAGVILGLASIDRACGTWGFSEDIHGGAKWLASQEPYTAAHGFFTGNAGVALALGVAGKRFDCPEWIDAARIRLREALKVERDCDLFSGAAGVLWAACLLSEILEDHKICELAAPCGKELIRLSEVRRGLCVWPSAEPGDPSLTGAAHGSAGVALALAIWGRMTGRSEAIDLALETFERLFRNGRLMDGTMLLRAVDEESEEPSSAPVLPWCHGVAGYLWCMLLAFGDDPRLKHAIDWSLEKCAAAKASASPVYCHGMAGQLELWRLIGKYPRLAESAASRADRAAWGLRLQLRREGGLCVWGAEDPEILTPDLWVGFLGPASALALYAHRVTEPLLSVAWLRSCASSKR